MFFYDCKKDIMISKACLWSEYTLAFLWSVLYYPVFYPSSWHDLGIESPPFGYLNNISADFEFLDEEEFHFGESLKSSAFRQTNPFLARPVCDLRDKPDKGVHKSRKQSGQQKGSLTFSPPDFVPFCCLEHSLKCVYAIKYFVSIATHSFPVPTHLISICK